MAFTCSCLCSCSWSVSSAVWGCCGVWTGFLAGLLPHEAGLSVSPSTVSSSPVAQTIARPVVWPPRRRQEEGERLLLCAPGARSKAAGERAIRVSTAGFACPNQQCKYFGNPDDQFHALVGDGKHGQAERIQTFRCQACYTPFSARRHTPLYRLKTPSHQVAVVLSALAEGLDASAAERVFGYRQATITSWLTRADRHAELFHEHSFCNLQLPHLQLDEIRTRLRRST